MKWERNNLDTASSPYLRQHADNPVWWQEWSRETLQHAKDSGRPLFVSVGYATCHWCHVMARNAFSDPDVADALNSRFVNVKIDREERPDIDHYLMQYLLATRGAGGWPLNAFLSPEGSPVLALTYIPVEPRGGMPGFVQITDRVIEFFEQQESPVPRFDLWKLSGASQPADPDSPPGAQDQTLMTAYPGPAEELHSQLNNLIDKLHKRYDGHSGGFGGGQKFPPHGTLLFLLHAGPVVRSSEADTMVRGTLDVMARRGLHDHLQGGFFRYCVDPSWTIPHFEKMLYDQAMLLWNYSLAWHVYRQETYRSAAHGILRCLRDTFWDQDVLISAHDADTDHREGATYVWRMEELKQAGQAADQDAAELFELPQGGNFEGRFHLVRRSLRPLTPEQQELMDHLLTERRKRPQPEADRKIVTAWNALAGVAIVAAARYLDDPEALSHARSLLQELRSRNKTKDHRWIRSSLGNRQNPVEFLEDYAAVLLLTTFLAEHAASVEELDRWRREIESLEKGVRSFHTAGRWVAARPDDFDPIPADTFDSPTPSPVALAELSLIRAALITDRAPELPRSTDSTDWGREQERDAHNLSMLLRSGDWYVLHRRKPLPWTELPPNVIQIVAGHDDWCHRMVCNPDLPSTWNPPPGEA